MILVQCLAKYANDKKGTMLEIPSYVCYSVETVTYDSLVYIALQVSSGLKVPLRLRLRAMFVSVGSQRINSAYQSVLLTLLIPTLHYSTVLHIDVGHI